MSSGIGLLLFAIAALAAEPRRPVHTYSIVARDPETGQIGVAVQSHFFAVGPIVPWAEAGVGAVATQSFVDPAYGPRGLLLMRTGLGAPAALAGLLSQDQAADVRQVAMVDAHGAVAAHTGARCIDYAGDRTGDGWSVQANMMGGDGVVDAMATAFEAAKGTLGERLVVALEAAEAAGGDIRGRQSAALLVVAGEGTGRPWLGADVVVDLRVDDDPNPVVALRRLLVLYEAYAHVNAGDVYVEKGDIEGAAREYAAGAALAPDNVEIAYWRALTLATIGKVDESLPLFKDIFRREPVWVELTRRLEKPGLLPPPEVVERILSQAPRRAR